MIPISNQDAHDLQILLERANKFYRNHATATRHINDGRRMAILAKKLQRNINKVNRAAATPRPQIKQQ